VVEIASSLPRNDIRHFHSAGFTFVELLATIVLISIVMPVVMRDRPVHGRGVPAGRGGLPGEDQAHGATAARLGKRQQPGDFERIGPATSGR
jgi:prepilin-type N-terminal cleavage/methylation domain-containing protein